MRKVAKNVNVSKAMEVYKSFCFSKEKRAINIDIDKLKSMNFFGDEDRDNQALTKDLKKNGLLVPLIVAGPYRKGQFKILDGAKRMYVIKNELHLTGDVACVIVAPALDDDDLKEIAHAINSTQRRDKTVVDMVVVRRKSQMNNIKKATGLPVQENEDIPVNVGDRYNRKLDEFARNGSEEIFKLVEDRTIPLATGMNLAKTIPDKAAQDAMADRIRKSTPAERKDISKRINDHGIINPFDSVRDNVENEILVARTALKKLLDDNNAKPADYEKVADLCKAVISGRTGMQRA